MANPKQMTLLQKWGFKDPDLTTPRHDAILCWLADNALEILGIKAEPVPFGPAQAREIALEVARKVTEDWVTPGRFQKEKEQGYTRESYVNEFVQRVLQKAPECIVPTATPKWEVVVKNDRDYTVGFIDMQIEIRVPTSSSLSANFDHHGSADPAVYRWTTPGRYYKYWCEAKSTIPSLGELFRQLSVYRQFLDHNRQHHELCVVSPDDRHRGRIESQGYKFIKAPDNVKA